MKRFFLFLLIISFTAVFSQKTLETVTVTSKKKGLQKSLTKTANTTIVTSKELLKAACCNIAESFETNPSIDVNFPDALTGTKQIKMLGLTSPYIMITEENIPMVRGASQVYGLSFVPGTWVESIQITKGAGSVINGYESISGQINTELIKPLRDVPFFVNAYADSGARTELNTHANHKFNDKWATSFFLHTNSRFMKNDMNHDHFLDNPLAKQVNFTNRWQYSNPETGWVAFFNAKYLDDNKLSGQLDFDKTKDKFTTNAWGSEVNTQRLDLSSKIGYVFKDMPFQSIGFQNAFSQHNQTSYFGFTTYDIKQQSLYSNTIFNSIINNTLHKFSTGITFTYDRYQEFVNSIDVSRIDNSAGAFFEYSYDNNNNLSFTLGGRIDYHNRLGVFATPRLHIRYNPWEKAVLRLSAGRGKRAANIYAENQLYFASNRTWNILDTNGKIYGLNPEIAWNYGLSFSQNFSLFHRPADVTLDFYRTDFQNQVVVDVMQSARDVLFYNLNGKSYANSLQLDFNYSPVTHFSLRTSYKFFDVKTQYITGIFQKPLQAQHRFFANAEYETHINNGKQWRFDATYNWLGKQQLPTTIQNPISEQMPVFSNPFATVNVQVTRIFSKNFEAYAGGENITNYRQNKAILGSHNPFGTHFDATVIYAPVFGQMYYAGIRYKL